MSSTESLDDRYLDIEDWPTDLAVGAMIEGQIDALIQVKKHSRNIARASEAAADRLKKGGRIAYVGAGTSGRVAIQDGVELGPTFNWPKNRLIYLMAGGDGALLESVEGAEDNVADAHALIASHKICVDDVVIGIAASGNTPFTVSALKSAKMAGALTIAIANSPASALLEIADYPLLMETGGEIVTGSTRMKAGTAQKAVINIISTTIMLRLGRIYRGQMVDMVISNNKLKLRAQRIVTMLSSCDAATSAKALDTANNDIKLAILIARGHDIELAQITLLNKDRNLGEAIKALELD